MSLCYTVGIDEVGRGPLAGPVTVCALIMRREAMRKFVGDYDSKKLSVKQREELFARIREHKKEGKLDFAICSVSHKVIDQKGIVYAVHLAISRALARLNVSLGVEIPNLTKVLLDGGLRAPSEFRDQQTIIKGDAKVPIIGLASVIAKVYRDKRMINSVTRYPNWGFEKNKGYGTRAHYQALKKHGPSPIHRKTFLH